jgi:hypothetical protein
VTVAALALSGCGGGHKAAPPRPGPGCTTSRTCSVLFIGNSYTAVNDLPAVFTQLAKSAGLTVRTGALVPGGTTLADHVASSDTASTIAGSVWNVVVLQDQSQVPSVEETRESEMYPAARVLVDDIRRARAEPLFFDTWAHSGGWPEEGLAGYEQMQSALNEAYQTIGRELSVPVVPVGSAWERELGMTTHPQLWGPDGSHPTLSGTYLAACVFYATIFHRSPVGLKYSAGMPSSDAIQLQAVAANTVLGV